MRLTRLKSAVVRLSKAHEELIASVEAIICEDLRAATEAHHSNAETLDAEPPEPPELPDPPERGVYV